MKIEEMPEIPDEIKKKMMEFLEKVAKTFPEGELEKSLPLVKSVLDAEGFMSLLGITSFLMDFLIGQNKKKEQPDIKVQIDIMKDYFRLSELHNNDSHNKDLKEPAKKLLKLCENTRQIEEFVSEWEEIVIKLEKTLINGSFFTNEENCNTTNQASAIFEQISSYDPKKRVN